MPWSNLLRIHIAVWRGLWQDQWLHSLPMPQTLFGNYFVVILPGHMFNCLWSCISSQAWRFWDCQCNVDPWKSKGVRKRRYLLEYTILFNVNGAYILQYLAQSTTSSYISALYNSLHGRLLREHISSLSLDQQWAGCSWSASHATSVRATLSKHAR